MHCKPVLLSSCRLSDVLLEHAIPVSPGGSGLPALGVEECVCSEEYSGLSCQVYIPVHVVK